MAWYYVTIKGNPYADPVGAFNGDVVGNRVAKKAAKAHAAEISRANRGIPGGRASVVKSERKPPRAFDLTPYPGDVRPQPRHHDAPEPADEQSAYVTAREELRRRRNAATGAEREQLNQELQELAEQFASRAAMWETA